MQRKLLEDSRLIEDIATVRDCILKKCRATNGTERVMLMVEVIRDELSLVDDNDEGIRCGFAAGIAMGANILPVWYGDSVTALGLCEIAKANILMGDDGKEIEGEEIL